MPTKEVATRPVDALKAVVNSASVQQQFRNALQENAPLFTASLIDLYASDTYLQRCDPSLVIMEALKAATLKLPINKQLGFAWIVPYKKGDKQIPQFQIGYRGYLQLAMRSGQYRYINAGPVYEGELVSTDKLTGAIDLSGPKKSNTIIGYFAYLETNNGFKKTVFGTTEEVEAHAKRYSKSFHYKESAWKTAFHEMCVKTMIRQLFSKYGLMSVEIIQALTSDYDDRTDEGKLQDQIENSGSDIIDIPDEHEEKEPVKVQCPDMEPGEFKYQTYCDEQCKKRDGCPSWDLAAPEFTGVTNPSIVLEPKENFKKSDDPDIEF